MSGAGQARRISRAIEIVSPSLAPRATESEAAPPPPCSPSLLGGVEAPLLPEEDALNSASDDESDEWEDVPNMMSREQTGVALSEPVAANSPSLAPAQPRVDPPVSVAHVSGVRSPSLFANAPPPVDPTPVGMRLVKLKEKVIKFKRAPTKRASRAARPSDPSPRAKDVCRSIIAEREQELKSVGRTKQMADDVVRYRASSSGGKGPSVRAGNEQEQAKMNHIAQIKAKNIDSHNTEASWLLWGNTAEQCYDRLAESALRSNAVNSSVVKRRETQAASYQSKLPAPTRHILKLARAFLTLTPVCAPRVA